MGTRKAQAKPTRAASRKSTRNKTHVVTAPKVEQVCVCQGESDDTRFIECETCHTWYHFDCVGLDARIAEEIGSYICDSCHQKTGRRTTMNWEDFDLALGKTSSGLVVNAESDASDVEMTPGDEEPASDDPSDEESVPDQYSDSSDEEYVEDAETKPRPGQRKPRRGADKRAGSSAPSGSHSPPPTAPGRRPAKSLKRKGSEMDVPSKKPRDAQEYEREETPPADSDPVRKYCVGKLSALLKPMFTQYYAPTEGEEEEEGDRIERVIGAFVTELEMALYKTYGENDKHGKLAAGQKYKDRFRMLAFNLEKKDRVLLRQRIGSGALSASELSTMSSVDLANEQQKAQIDNAIKESLKDSILEARAAPKAKITHKGEEMIENVGGEDENTRVRSAEAEREYSREAQIARGRAQSDAAASAPLGTTSPGAAMADLPYADDALMSPILPTSTLPRSPIERRHSNASQGDSPKSPLMTKSPVFFDQPLPSATSPVSPSTAGFNLNSLAWSTNENEPADALSNSPRGDSDYFLSNNENGGGRNGDVLDTALDIDVDLDDEPDFDVFLDDVGVDGESSAKPTEEKKVEMVDEKLAKYLALPQVWQGNVEYMDGSTTTVCQIVSRQIGGRNIDSTSPLWSALFPHSMINIRGRIPTENSSSFLVQMRLNPSRELVAVAFSPSLESETQPFDKIFNHLISKNRHAIALPWGDHPSPTAPGKELYLVPLRPADPIPEFVELLDSMQLPPNRQQNVLLGIFILYRGRLNFNAPPPVPLPSVIPPSIFSSLTPLAPPPPPPSQPLPNSADLAKAIASLTPEQLELVTKLGLGGSIPSLAGLPPTNPFLSTQPLSYSNVVPPFPLPQNSPPQPLLGYQAQPPASYQSSPPRRDSNQGFHRNDRDRDRDRGRDRDGDRGRGSRGGRGRDRDYSPRGGSGYRDGPPPSRRFSDDNGRDYPPRGHARDDSRQADSGWGSRGRGRGRGRGHNSPNQYRDGWRDGGRD